MPLQVSVYGSRFPLEYQNVDRNRHVIVCAVPGAPISSVEIKFPLAIDNSADWTRYMIFLLGRKDLIESDIYQVYDTTPDRRIGWCFPVQALNSTEHSYADNEHFLRYAYVAAMKLLRESPESDTIRSPEVDGSGPVSLADFFSECAAVLVVSMDTLEAGAEFDITDWIPSLYECGYVLLRRQDPDGLFVGERRPGQVRLNLRPVSKELGTHSFIESVFCDLLAFERNPLLIFFYLYQVVELLLEDVFRTEQEALVNELISVRQDSVKTKKVLQKAGSIASEKHRLHLLVNQYLKQVPDSAGLRAACNGFLEGTGQEACGEVCEALYTVRNILFHQYRDVRDHDPLTAVINEMAPFLIRALSEFVIRVPREHE
jgi:hypothetical protein